MKNAIGLFDVTFYLTKFELRQFRVSPQFLYFTKYRRHICVSENFIQFSEKIFAYINKIQFKYHKGCGLFC